MTMARTTIVLAVGIGLVLPAPAGAGHGGSDVLVRDIEFVPEVTSTFVFRNAPDAVEWEGDPADPPLLEHNVRELHGIFSSGPPSLWTAKLFSLKLSAGKFEYQCRVHGAQGMSGRVNVRPLLEDATADGFPVVWASEDTETGQAFDVQYRIGPEGRWRNWRIDTTKFRGVFGKNDRPVELEPGREYYVRVRSQKRVGTPNAHSRYFALLLD
jgi:hypothetical protein